MEKLSALNAQSYAEQAKHYLNAYWKDKFEDDEIAREKVWQHTQNMIKLDPKGAKGNELSEIKAHLFIEKTGSATTWIKFRNVMQKINKDFNNRMSLTEFFIFIAKLDWKELVKRNVSYGKEAQEALDTANATMQEVADGLSFIIAEEKKKADKIAKLKAKSEDDKLSTTKRGIAFSEMKVCMSEDPLPLRKAKLEQEAAVRKAKKALAHLRKKLGGVGEGTLWYMDRELEEGLSFLPKSKQKALKKKAQKAKAALLGKSTKGGKKKAAAAGAAVPMSDALKSGGKNLKKTKTKKGGDALTRVKVNMSITKGAKLRKAKKSSGGDALARGKVAMSIAKGKKLKKVKAGSASAGVARAKMTMEISKPQKLNHVDAPDSGASDAIKRAFVEDQHDK